MIFIATSDWHIWSDYYYNEIRRACRKIEQEDPPVLVLNGDIADPWKAEWPRILSTNSWKRLQELVEYRHNHGRLTVWVKGNHDYDAEGYYLPGARADNSYRFMRWEFRHGWEFDWTWKLIHPLAFWLSSKAPNLMVPVHKMIMGQTNPGIQKAGAYAQDWNAHVAMIHYNASAYAKKRGVKLVIGHTHCPLDFNGLIADCGDLFDESFVYG